MNGVARRLGILRRGLHNVFSLFPPSAVRPIDTDNLHDAQISLHAFVINSYGLFDNLAWAFVWRHGLEATINRRQVSMFSEGIKQYLPQALRSKQSNMISAPRVRYSCTPSTIQKAARRCIYTPSCSPTQEP
jgi:hypothetical protein